MFKWKFTNGAQMSILRETSFHNLSISRAFKPTGPVPAYRLQRVDVMAARRKHLHETKCLS